MKVHDHAPDALRYFAQTVVQAWRVSIDYQKAA
jgi:hypothetical protein